MSVAVLAIRCPDGVVRRPLADEADEMSRRKLVKASGTRGSCIEGCPGGRHALETHATRDAFLAAHAKDGRPGPALTPEAERGTWTPKRVGPGATRACRICRHESQVTTWVRDRCPACGGRDR